MLHFFSPQPRYRPLILEVDTTKPGSANDTFILPVRSNRRYIYVVEWGDGSVEKCVTDTNVTHVYPAPGTYFIKVHGYGYGKAFPVLYFSNVADKEKLINIVSFGDVKVTELAGLFYGCSNLTSIASGKCDSAGAISAQSLFRACAKFNCDISSLNTQAVTDFTYFMFGATVFNNPVAGLITNSATAMVGMFYQASAFNQPLPFNTSKVATMGSMLRSCPAFKQDISGFDISSLTDASNMMSGSDINETGTTTRYDALLNSMAGQSYKPNVPFHGGNAKYSSAASASRAKLVGDGWTIQDGGLAT